MKVRRLTLRGLITIYMLGLVSLRLFGQEAAADRKIIEIESFGKYAITKIDNKQDLRSLSDSGSEILEVVNYKRKGKNDLSGKVTENSRTRSGEIKRTYYFNEQSALFAIADEIKPIDKVIRKLTYYFGGGQLTKVVDEGKNDVTNTIDQQQLYYLIRKRFGDGIIK